MRKKIILQVDKIVNKPIRKETAESSSKILPEKKCSFDQMYRQAKKMQNKSNLNATLYHHGHHSAPTSFHSLYDSLKGSRNTPKNTNRRRQDSAQEKLNHSLEAKTSSLEKASPVKRSNSSEKRRLVQRKKEDNVVQKKGARQQLLRAHNDNSSQQWQGQEQFQLQWKQVISGMDHKQHEHLRETQCFLSLQEIFQVLRSMHYLRKVQDEKYLLNLWQELQGQTYGGVPSNNLHDFLAIINYCPSNICYQLDKGLTHKRIVIDNNLKIVISQAAKLQIYEEYLTLRVNRILYGSAVLHPQNPQQHKNQAIKMEKGSNNIKIVDDQQGAKRRIVLGPSRKGSDKHTKPHLTRQKRSEEITRISEQEQKQHNDDTICYSQFSEGKESGKNLISNESQNSIVNHELIEQVVIKRPILSVDVNLGEGLCEKLTVFEGESALQVSKRLVEKYNIDESLRAKFQVMLSGHIRNLLYRIDEVSEEMFSDRQE